MTGQSLGEIGVLGLCEDGDGARSVKKAKAKLVFVSDAKRSSKVWLVAMLIT